MKKLLCLITFSLIALTFLCAQAPADKIIDEYLATLPMHSEISIAHIQSSLTTFQGYKMQDGKPIKIDNRDRIFEIGSITKTFTAALLTQQVMDGKMKMDDPVSLYLSDEKLTQGIASQVSLKQLITHTSGLSNGPGNFLWPFLRAMIFSGDNPYRHIKWRHYRKYLKKGELDHEPGSKWAYNNPAVSLLGYLIAQQENTTWENLVQQLFTKLEMNSTYPNGLNVLRELAVQGYDEKGKKAGYWDMDFINPAGSIKSSAADMVTWINAHLKAKGGSLFDLMKTKYEIETRTPNHFMGNAWAHNVQENKTIIWFGGATGTFRSFVAFDDEKKTGIVILTNYSAHHPSSKLEDGKSTLHKYGLALLEVL